MGSDAHQVLDEMSVGYGDVIGNNLAGHATCSVEIELAHQVLDERSESGSDDTRSKCKTWKSLLPSQTPNCTRSSS